MTAAVRHYWALATVAVVLCALLIVTLLPYRGNVSALFHLDQITQEQYGVTPDFVVLTVPGYDGEQYYQIAKQMPATFTPSEWPALREHSSQAYAYQRFLLPFMAFVISFGQVGFLPYTFLIIQLAALLGTAFLMLKRFPTKPLYTVALTLCPAALLGLHFSLAEPLTIYLLTAFLLRCMKHQRMYALDVLLLCLFVLTREINILFIGLLLIWFLGKRQWHTVLMLLIPVATFVALHTAIYAIFHQIPFLWSADKHAFPLTAIIDVLIGRKGYSVYTLSSIALFLGFVLPAFLWSASNAIKRKMTLFLPLFSCAFLCVMLLMPDHIWGSITSIGRVITPVYPLVIVQAASRDTLAARAISVAILVLGLTISIALALIPHPYVLS